MIRPEDETERAVDRFTSSVDTLLTAIAQRTMTEEQMERLAVILQRAELSLLARLKPTRRSRTVAMAAGSSTRSTAAVRAPKRAA